MVFGKSVSDLQTDVEVADSAITGTLKYVTGYTEFSSVTDEQKGNYLALKLPNGGESNVVTTVEVVGGTKGPVTLDADRNIVLLIKSNTDQSIRVIHTLNGTSTTKTFTLTGLTLTPGA